MRKVQHLHGCNHAADADSERKARIGRCARGCNGRRLQRRWLFARRPLSAPHLSEAKLLHITWDPAENAFYLQTYRPF